MTVFQRTPNFSIPSRNGPMPDEYEQSWKDVYPAKRAEARMTRNGILANPNDFGAMEVSDAERRAVYEKRWESGGTTFMAAFNDLIFNQESNDTAAEFVRGKIRAIVKDPVKAELLAPKNHPIGTKRICVDTEYYQTYNRPNVRSGRCPLDARSRRSRPTACVVGGREYQADAIVFATGFDAMTGALTRDRHRRPDGETLAQKWEAGPRTYLGLMTAGFPNLFMITGPGSPSVLSNMMVSIEQHVDWIADCLAAYAVSARPVASRRPRRPRTTGSRTSTRSPTRRSIRGGILVHGRQHPRQAAGLHALYRRRRRVSGDVRQDRGERL